MNTFKIIFISAIISYSVIFIFNEEVIKKETKQNFVEMKELLAEKGNEISSVKYTIEYNRQDMLERESPIECKRTKTIIDLKTGTLGGLKPTDTRESIMKKFPCFNYNYMGDDNYGGGVFYNDHAFYFYTNAKSIEIRKKFRGLMSSDDNSAQFMNFVKNDKDTIKKQLSDYGFDL